MDFKIAEIYDQMFFFQTPANRAKSHGTSNHENQNWRKIQIQSPQRCHKILLKNYS